MPRIAPAPERGLVARLINLVVRRRFGAVPEPFTIIAHHPKLLRAAAVHEAFVERGSRTLPANVRELAVYRVAVRLGCSWCVDFGTMLQKFDGLDVERLTAIDDYATSPRFTHAERLALAYADAMTETPVTVTDEQVSELVAEFGEQGVVELSYQIGLENQRARTYSALGIRDQGFTSGDACRIPPRRAG